MPAGLELDELERDLNACKLHELREHLAQAIACLDDAARHQRAADQPQLVKRELRCVRNLCTAVLSKLELLQ